jgi:hypothetical protein
MYRVRLPLTATVQDLAENMHKRLGNEKRESHRLYLQERGRGMFRMFIVFYYVG